MAVHRSRSSMTPAICADSSAICETLFADISQRTRNRIVVGGMSTRPRGTPAGPMAVHRSRSSMTPAICADSSAICETLFADISQRTRNGIVVGGMSTRPRGTPAGVEDLCWTTDESVRRSRRCCDPGFPGNARRRGTSGLRRAR